MEIFIGKGLDIVQFGITQNDIIELIGKPNRINNNEIDGCVALYYNNLMTKFLFRLEEQNKLYSIETSNPNLLLYNNTIIGMKKAQIETLQKKRN